MARIPRVLAKRGPYRPRPGFASKRRWDEAKHKREKGSGRFAEMPDQLRMELRKPVPEATRQRAAQLIAEAEAIQARRRPSQRALKTEWNTMVAQAMGAGVSIPGGLRPWRGPSRGINVGRNLPRVKQLRAALAAAGVGAPRPDPVGAGTVNPALPMSTVTLDREAMRVFRSSDPRLRGQTIDEPGIRMEWANLPESNRNIWRQQAQRRLASITPEENAILTRGDANEEFRSAFASMNPQQRRTFLGHWERSRLRVGEPSVLQPPSTTPPLANQSAEDYRLDYDFYAVQMRTGTGAGITEDTLLRSWAAMSNAHREFYRRQRLGIIPTPSAPPPPTAPITGVIDNVAHTWNRIVRIPPEQFAAELNAGLPPGVTVSTEVAEASSGLVLSFSFKRAGTQVGRATRFYRTSPDGIRVDHSLFSIDRGAQNSGIGKPFMRASMLQYQRMGVSDIEVSAGLDVGGYAWAKYGFKLDHPSTAAISGTVGNRINALERDGQINAVEADTIRAVMAGNSPTKLWHVADAKQSVVQNGKTLPLGKALLLNTNWHGHINLSDREAMDRFWAYVTPPAPAVASPPMRYVDADTDREGWDNVMGIDADQFVREVSKDMPGPVLVSTSSNDPEEQNINLYFTKPRGPDWRSPSASDVNIMRRHGIDPAQFEIIGNASRRVTLSGSRRTVYHASFTLRRRFQGSGVGKLHMRNMMDQYRRLGVTKVTTAANIDIGGHAWAKYGYRLDDPSNSSFKQDLLNRLRQYHSVLTPEQLRIAQDNINSNSSKKLWVISDMKEPVVTRRVRDIAPDGSEISVDKPMSLGKALLIDRMARDLEAGR